MIAHFLVPYEQVRLGDGKPRRVLEIDRATEQIEDADGYWSEAEIDGDQAIVRVRAPKAIMRDLGTSFRLLDDPESVWTPDRAVPANRDGEVVFTDVRHGSRSLADLADDVLTDKRLAELKAAAADVMVRADTEGYVRLGLPWPDASRLLNMVARHGYGLDRISTGTFPTQGVLDNFNRASLGTNWTTWAGVALTIASSTLLAANATDGEGYWNVATYGPGSEVYVDFSTKPPDNTYIALHLRVTTPGASNNSYELNFQGATGTDLQGIARYDAGAGTNLGGTNSLEFSDGDSIGFEAFGSTLTAYKKTGGSWSSAFSRTDSTYIQAGYLSVYIQSTTTRLDNFGGGTIPGGPPPGSMAMLGVGV